MNMHLCIYIMYLSLVFSFDLKVCLLTNCLKDTKRCCSIFVWCCAFSLVRRFVKTLLCIFCLFQVMDRQLVKPWFLSVAYSFSHPIHLNISLRPTLSLAINFFSRCLYISSVSSDARPSFSVDTFWSLWYHLWLVDSDGFRSPFRASPAFSGCSFAPCTVHATELVEYYLLMAEWGLTKRLPYFFFSFTSVSLTLFDVIFFSSNCIMLEVIFFPIWDRACFIVDISLCLLL